MIRRNNEYVSEIREQMRGGEGTVKLEHFFDAKNELKGLNRMVARLTLAPGSSIGFHRHENEAEIFIVVRGEAEIDDNGVKSTVKTGDAILTGFGAGHAVRSTGKEPLELVAVITEVKG